MVEFVWVFNGSNRNNNFPGAVFSTKALAEEWIQKYQLTGVLTKYPVDISVFDWVVANNLGKLENLKEQMQNNPSLIGSFSSAYQEHYHYENGLEPGYESKP